MSKRPVSIDLEKLARVVDTAAGCITQGIEDYFQLRLVSRAQFRDDDPLMTGLTTGATEQCFGVELIDAIRGDEMAVKVQGIRCARAYTRRCAGMLWRAWVRCGGPDDHAA